MFTRKCSIMILNYNGRHLLEKCLPSVIEAVKYNGGEHEIIVVDNASSDESIFFVKKKFPIVRILAYERNNILFTYNDAIKHVDNNYIIFLNNDIKVNKKFLKPLLSHFDNPRVFAVGPKVLDIQKGSIQRAAISGSLGQGLFNHIFREKGGLSLYVSGAVFVCDKTKFIEVGGFDELYRPFYWEETDLCYNAWKRGLICICDFQVEVYHENSATIKTVAMPFRRDVIFTKNHFLFQWKNITDKRFWVCHLFLTVWRLLWALLFPKWLNRCYLLGFLLALKQLPELIKKKRRDSNHSRVLSDREILKLCSIEHEQTNNVFKLD